jgi:hypothetical protein
VSKISLRPANKCNGRKSNAATIKWEKRPKHKPIKGK